VYREELLKSSLLKNLIALFSENKQAILFLVKFISLYFILNTVYGLYVESYSPAADPITHLVSMHSQQVLSWLQGDIQLKASELSKSIAVQKGGNTVINVYEGCNSVNVMIVFLAFTFAFSVQWYRYWKFILMGLLILYITNILRVIALFWVALYFPNSLYFFHKFFFTGVIYAVVFLLWYWWIKKQRKIEQGTTAN